MRICPKGYRALLVCNGEVFADHKCKSGTTIYGVFAACTGQLARDKRVSLRLAEDVYLVVQPRGRNTWWVFRTSWSDAPEVIAKTPSKDVALMAAVLL